MRKLAIGAFAFSAAIFASNYIFSRSSVIYAAVFCALLGAAVLGVRLKSLRGLVIAALCATLGFAVFAAHYDLTTEKAHELSGQTDEYCFRLLASPERYASYTRVDAQLYSKGLPHLNTVLYDSEGRLDDYNAGDLLIATVRLSASDIRYGVHTDRYNAKDIYLTGTIKSELQLEGKRHSITTYASLLCDLICKRVERVFPEDTAAFMKALMVGEKRELYENDALYVSLSRAGLMHIVAVSGMHISYLVGFLQLVFGKDRRNSIACLLLVWCFVLISGVTPSALRAAFMQSMLLLAPLFGRENDPITSLSAALAFLLLLNPFAATNISLQLSFTAMLGIVLFSERIEEALLRPFGEGKAADLLRRPIGSIACSLSVLIFTVPVTALYFGYVTLLSPMTNLLCLFIVPYCFVGGYMSCLLSFIPALGRVSALVISWLVRYLFFISKWVSSLSFSAIYLPTGWMLVWSGFVYLILFATLGFCRKPYGKIAIPLAAALASLFAISTGLRLYYASAEGTVTAIDVGQGQCICAMAGDRAVIVDCGSTSYAEYNAGDCAAAYLKIAGIRQIDALVLTHLHADHANGIERLGNLMAIERLILPVNVDDSDQKLTEILRCASQHGIPVEWIDEDQLKMLGDIGVMLFSPDDVGDENERCMPVILSIGDYDVITTGDASAKREKSLAERANLRGVDVLIVGHHGSKTSSAEEYLAEIGGRTAIISVGKNAYGLPASETLDRLDAFGYTVFRTDAEGNVELRIDG